MQTRTINPVIIVSLFMFSSIRVDVTVGLRHSFAQWLVTALRGLNMSSDKNISDFPVRNMLHYVTSDMARCDVIWKWFVDCRALWLCGYFSWSPVIILNKIHPAIMTYYSTAIDSCLSILHLQIDLHWHFRQARKRHATTTTTIIIIIITIIIIKKPRKF
jgi:hypothetical protein